MLGLLSTRVLTTISRRTKVLRPAHPKINPGPMHTRPAVNDLKLWELSFAFFMLTAAVVGPAIYYVPQWQGLKVEEED